MNILEIGIEQSRTEIIQNMLKNGLTCEKVSELTQIPLEIVKEAAEKLTVLTGTK